MAKAERRAPLEKPHSPFFETIYAVRGGSARGSLPRPRGMLSQDYCCGEPSGGTNPEQADSATLSPAVSYFQFISEDLRPAGGRQADCSCTLDPWYGYMYVTLKQDSFCKTLPLKYLPNT